MLYEEMCLSVSWYARVCFDTKEGSADGYRHLYGLRLLTRQGGVS